MGKRKKTVRERVLRAQRAWNDLGLSLVTKADKERWVRIWDGLEALDEEQSKLKSVIEGLFDENADLGTLTFDQIKEAFAEEGVSFEKRTVTAPINSPEADALFDTMLKRSNG